MRGIKPSCLYQETRLNLDPASPSSTVDLLLPVNGASAFASRLSPKRRRIDRATVLYDETTFSVNHLASESSIYFRPQANSANKDPSPRAILWRVLDERKVLELQAVDLSQGQTDKNEPLVTLRLAFPHAIRASGIAFAEKSDKSKEDGFLTFVLTTVGDIVTLELHKDHFVRTQHVEDTSVRFGEWCKTYSPSAFSHRTPYRFFAKSDSELWISLNDGSLLRLESEDHGSKWRESFFTEGGWIASMRGLIPWKAQPTVRCEDVDIASNATVSMAASPEGMHIWAACLDHTLKAWNANTGKITFVTDLDGDASRDLQIPVAPLLDPSRADLIRIVPAPLDGEYVVATFSPKSRAFKFWAVKDANSGEFGVQDMRPDVALVPPVEELADSAMWTLETFELSRSNKARQNECVLWTLLRFGAKCQSFNVKFNLDDHTDGLMQSWQNNWSCVDPGLNAIGELQQNLQNPGDTPSTTTKPSDASATEQWLEFLFFPSRFTVATLETALSVYWKSLGSALQTKKQSVMNLSRPLKARICDTLSLSASLERGADDEIAFTRFEHDIEFQWQIFFGVVKDLHKRREEPLSLAYDSEQDFAWLVMADQISAVRTVSEVEVLWLNRNSFALVATNGTENTLMQSLTDPIYSEIGQLFNAVAIFRATFSRSFLLSFRSLLQAVNLVDPEQAPLNPVQMMYDRSAFAGQVSDEDYNKVTSALDGIGGLANLNNDMFLNAVNLLGEAQKGHHQNRQLTRYGARALVRGAQETIELSCDILLDLLLLVIFIGGELEEGDFSGNFEVNTVFTLLASKLQEFNLLYWLASTTTQEKSISETSEINSTASALASSSEGHAPTSTTVLESVFIGDWEGMLFPSVPQSILLTYWCRAWTFGARLSEQYESITSHVMGTLLKDRHNFLAYDFVRFLSESPWALYLRARLYLAIGEFTAASSYFEHAAKGFVAAKYFDIEQFDSAELVDLTERNLFNDGPAAFYQHVTNLFEKAGSMSYVAQFASKALNSMEHVDIENVAMRTELLSRLFTASLQTSRFPTACSTLKQYTDLALQRSELHSLLKALISRSQVPLLLTLPLPLPDEVDAYLSSLALKSNTQWLPSAVVSEVTDPQYHKILYAYRFRRGNLRGAATCLWERLQMLQAHRDSIGGYGVNEVIEQDIMQTFLTLINALSLMDSDQAWILIKPPSKNTLRSSALPKLKIGKAHAQSQNECGKNTDTESKRKVVTLSDVRKVWQDELDRSTDFRAGRFPLFFMAGAVNGDAANGVIQSTESAEVDVFA